MNATFKDRLLVPKRPIRYASNDSRSRHRNNAFHSDSKRSHFVILYKMKEPAPSGVAVEVYTYLEPVQANDIEGCLPQPPRPSPDDLALLVDAITVDRGLDGEDVTEYNVVVRDGREIGVRNTIPLCDRIVNRLEWRRCVLAPTRLLGRLLPDVNGALSEVTACKASVLEAAAHFELDVLTFISRQVSYEIVEDRRELFRDSSQSHEYVRFELSIVGGEGSRVNFSSEDDRQRRRTAEKFGVVCRTFTPLDVVRDVLDAV